MRTQSYGGLFLKINPALFFSLSLTLAIATSALCQQEKPNKVVVERVGDTAFIQLHAPSFQVLSPRQQALAYWLTQASIAIDPIFYDQLSAYGLRQKRCLKKSWRIPNGIDPAAMPKIAEFAKLFWANRGNHNELTSQKFLPAFTFDAAEESRARRTAKRSLPDGICRSPAADRRPADLSERTGRSARLNFRSRL